MHGNIVIYGKYIGNMVLHGKYIGNTWEILYGDLWEIYGKSGDLWDLPFGKRLQNYGKIHHLFVYQMVLGCS